MSTQHHLGCCKMCVSTHPCADIKRQCLVFDYGAALETVKRTVHDLELISRNTDKVMTLLKVKAVLEGDFPSSNTLLPGFPPFLQGRKRYPRNCLPSTLLGAMLSLPFRSCKGKG